VIKLGDWIDLEGGLSVAEYSGAGGFTAANTDLGGAKGYLLRLIVVGINSFHTVTANDGVDHVVFQFQNMPVLRRMNATDTNPGGYRASEMRKYLTTVEGDADSGKFLAGLVAAGVPKSVMWDPVRHVATVWDTGGTTVKDLLWLPTEREMLGTQSYAGNYEAVGNQARLEYYIEQTKRIKYVSNGTTLAYFLGGARFSGSNTASFVAVTADGAKGMSVNASYAGYGCVPAFCIY
jgi:hypothetical protein